MNINTRICYDGSENAVFRCIDILRRDMDKVFLPTDEDGGEIRLLAAELPAEQFFIKDGNVYAGDALGFVYGLLHISEHALGIPPFWFWYDYEPQKLCAVQVEDYVSAPACVRYRGWFLNDEILLSHWAPGGDADLPWHMAFEALLRCGGNMVIPDTQIVHAHSALAASYGLWLSHHHAEPLGAEMFVKAYPDTPPSYLEHPELFHQLWREGIRRQKDFNVVWDLGFRGQGDNPFWAAGKDSAYDTDEKRGALISEIMQLQYDMLKEEIDNPVCCTYLYGEVMELYSKGCLTLPEGIIKIFADNGYGRMVSRRINMDNPRTPALPEQNDSEYGIYYHVSYCDLQSCAHVTQAGASADFVTRELETAFERGADDYLVVNCSNIRPHVYLLAAISELWQGRSFSPQTFAKTYFGDEQAAQAYLDYADAAVQFGPHEDEKAGDHFYNHSVRTFVSDIMKHNVHSEWMGWWATGQDMPITEQIRWFGEKCSAGVDSYQQFLAKHTEDFGPLHQSTIMLHARLHHHGYQGGALFCRAYEALLAKRFLDAFYLTGLAAEEFDDANTLLRGSEYGVWQGYYANECFADFKFTAYVLRRFMFYIRNLGEGWGFWQWPRDLFYLPEDRAIFLQMNHDNHMTDEELFQRMKDADYRLGT